jgi:tetratricopeptide (TPR) repeat protein
MKPHREPLDFPDIFYLMAAEGWVELGNPSEASLELGQITRKCRLHPDVLIVRWAIEAESKNWDACLQIAASLVKVAPRRCRSWLQYSISLYRLDRTQEAYDHLLKVAKKFPQEWLVPYDLACYCAQLGKMEEAWHWLEQACVVGIAKDVKRTAVTDPDLEPLWKQMGLEKS